MEANANTAASGVWLIMKKESADSLHLQIKSPDSGVLKALRTESMATQQRPAHVCVNLWYGTGQGGTKKEAVYMLDGRGEVGESVSFESSNNENAGGYIEALLATQLTVQIQLSDVERDFDDNGTGEEVPLEDRECSGAVYQAVVQTDPESGQAVTVEIPVAPAMAYGDCFWWPVTRLTQKCFERGESWDECKDLSSREVVPCDCSYGACTMLRFQVGGYFQVHSKSNAGIIALATLLCVMLALVFVGSAVYFRKHPESWDGVKKWGPGKYKTIKQTMSTKV